ncbi:MAG: hypothetical protein QM817_07855 [Archangium sp.]
MPTELEFGLVSTTDFGRQELVLENPSDGAIFANLTPLQPPFDLDDVRAAVLPFTRKRVGVTFRPMDGRTQIARLTVSSDGCEDRVVELHGVGDGQVVVPLLVTSLPTPLGTSRVIPVPITNESHDEITLAVTSVVAGDGFTFPSTIVVPASSATTMQVTFEARAVGARGLLLQLRAGNVVRSCQVMASGGTPKARLEQSRLVIDPLPNDSLVDNTRHLAIFNDGPGELNLTTLRVLPALEGTDPFSLVSSPVSTVVPPGGSSLVNFSFAVTTPGWSKWTMVIGTDDVMMPVIELAIEANLADVLPCGQAVSTVPTQIDVQGPWPRSIPFDFTNPNATACLVENVHFEPPGGATTDLGVVDGFVVPAGATVRRVVTLTSSGNRGLAFRTYPSAQSLLFIRASD